MEGAISIHFKSSHANHAQEKKHSKQKESAQSVRVQESREDSSAVVTGSAKHVMDLENSKQNREKMTIYITEEITKAYESYVNDVIDWDFSGTPITRKSANQSGSIVDFAAGYQAASTRYKVENNSKDLQLPFCTSITGADDEVSVDVLLEIQAKYPLVEWAILYFPEKEGHPRNPTSKWRQEFLSKVGKSNSALHLCGTQVFREILTGNISEEFSGYGRIQLNINARRQEFTDEEVISVYKALLEDGHRLILQCHDATAELIFDFVKSLRSTRYFEQVDVLFDASRGRGEEPESWPAGYELPCGVRSGYAGGLNPSNMGKNLLKIQTIRKNLGAYWMDMESGVRTDNKLDRNKVESVLMTAEKEWI